MIWGIMQLDVMNIDGYKNVVVISRYTVSDVQNGITGRTVGSVTLLPPQGGDFTPYSKITEAQAVQWTQEALGTAGVAAAEAEVQADIDKQKIPSPQPAPLPW